MLEGKNVNLRVAEKEDSPLLAEWFSSLQVFGEYNPVWQISNSESEKIHESPNEPKMFIVERKDGSKIGYILHFNVLHTIAKMLEIGYGLVPTERGKGYCTEAAQIMLDYLFLSKETVCVQATTHVKNIASQRVLQKVGFKKEGIMRKRFFIQGEWQDIILFSILREEWKEPKILTKTQLKQHAP